MGILDGVVEWIAEQVMNILDMINTSVLGALGCDMETFLRYFPAAETFYSLIVALAVGLLLLNLIFQLFRNFGIMQSGEAESPVRLTARTMLFLFWPCFRMRFYCTANRRNSFWLDDDRGASAYQFCGF